MGKSIRSKIKRQHRAEFRRTIGTDAYDASMEKVQAKMKDSIEKQTLKSLDRLADALDTRDESAAMTDNEDDTETGTSALSSETTTTTTTTAEAEQKGENKVIISKRSKRKQKHGYRMKAIVAERKNADTKEKRKPKFHCAF